MSKPAPHTTQAAAHTEQHGSLKSYIIGFALSLILTFSSYFLVTKGVFGGNALLVALLVLAITQFAVQLIFFLHVANESKPRFNLMTFWAMLTVVALVVFLTLWIMKNLNYHMDMDTHQSERYIIEDEGVDSNKTHHEHEGAHH